MKRSFLLLVLLVVFNSEHGVAQWQQKGNDFNGGLPNDELGTSVSISNNGNVVIIGVPQDDLSQSDPGQVRVLQWTGTSWLQIGSQIDGAVDGDNFGTSTSINNDGSVVAAGAPWHIDNGSNFSGHVRVYERIGNSYQQKGSDIDGVGGERSGYSVSLSHDGESVAIGSPLAGGVARVFDWNGSGWVQRGNDIDDQLNFGEFGRSVSIDSSGNIIAVGAPRNSTNGNNAGQIRVFEWNGSAWHQKGDSINGDGPDDRFGVVSISKDGSTLAAGAPEVGSGTGYVKVFTWNGANWVQKGNDLEGTAANDQFGLSTSLNKDGNVLAIGAIGDNDGFTSSGQVKTYLWNGNAWNQSMVEINGQANFERFGVAVSLSADSKSLAVGAPGATVSTNDEGKARIYTCAIFDSLEVATCDNYVSPSGKHIWTTSGTYFDTLAGVYLCDSVLKIDLDVSPIDSNLTLDGSSIVSSESGASYQWINCETNALIQGETNQGFSPSESGRYAVIIDNGICTDTSVCFEILVAGLFSKDSPGIRIYPNPVVQDLNISANSNMRGQLTLMDHTGRILMHQNLTGALIKLDMGSLESGVYLLRLDCSQQVFTQRVVKR